MAIRRRRSLIYLALPPLLFGAYLWFKPDEPGTFTRGNFEKVQEGMARQEVEAILGPPVGTNSFEMRHTPEGATTLLWENFEGIGIIVVDKTGAVISTRTYFPQSLRERLSFLWIYVFKSSAPF